MNKIINLHCHSHFSLLDGMSSPLSIIEKAKEFGLNSIAITDHGNMNNFGDFYLQAAKKDFKAIFGVEFFTVKSLKRWKQVSEKISTDGTNKKDVRKKLTKRNHLVLLAKNENGLKNLNSMLFESYKEGSFYFRPRIDREIIEKFHKDIICSSACLMGEIQQHLLAGNQEAAEDAMNFYRDLFGKDFYLEIQFNELEEQTKVNLMMLELAKKNKIGAILTGDSHYTERKHQLTHQTLLLLQTKKTMKDLERGEAWEFSTKELYIKNYEDYKRDMKRFNSEIPLKVFDWLCENTLEIENKIEKIVLDKSIKMKDASSKIEDKNEYLKDLCEKALKEISMKSEKKKRYKDRMNFELNVIKEKKMANYFLTVYGIVRNARKTMLVGCGRGSSCGSLVNYLLQINEIDPLKYGLYFERFMAIERSDIPDIDLDFENNDLIKNTIIEKYGTDAAFISNYNTFQISGLIKDLGRTYGLESPHVFDKLNKRIRLEIEQNLDVDDDEAYKSISFDDAYGSSKSFKDFVDKHKEFRRDMELLLGKIKHIGRHAAGMIACDDLIRSQPTFVVDGKLQTSLCEGKDKVLSEFGFVKMDILGLNTLKILHNTLDLINKKYDDYIHPDKIDLKDEKIYKYIFRKGNLLGVFQFETNNIRQLIAKTKPDCFQDLVAMNALFRPGPLKGGLAFEYGDRKRGKIEVEYENKIVEKILGVTYGIIIYQEQVMELGHFLGGLSLPETNTLRKLLVKVKKNDEENKKKLKVLKDKFFEGCEKNGMEEEQIENLWEKMVAFAGYGFNLAHAVAYAMIAFQCSFLKFYHMKEFYCSLLNAEDVVNYGKIVNEIKSNDIEVKTLDLNNSEINFSIRKGIIYCGFANVFGIGSKAAETILKSRSKKEFDGFKDFITREDIDWRLCNKRVVETLIKIGAFDFGDEKRNLLLVVFQAYGEFKSHLNKKLAEWNVSKRQKKISEIYKELKSNKKLKKMNATEKSAIELAHYRFNVDFSPFVLNGRKEKITRLLSRGKAGGISEESDWMIVQFMNIKRFNDKRGEEMAFLDLIDVNNVMKGALIFSSNYEMEKVKENGVYLIQGKVQDKVLIDKYLELDSLLNKSEED